MEDKMHKLTIFNFLIDPIKKEKQLFSKIIKLKNHELIRSALFLIYGSKKVERWKPVNIKECKKEIEMMAKKCSRVMSNKLEVYIFPTVDEFVIKKMNGVCGFSNWKNKMLLGIFRCKGWRQALRNAFCHELAHALALNFNNRITLADDIVFEGIAENFREHFVGGKGFISISEKKAKKIFSEIKSRLNMVDDKLYQELFFGGGRYPLWSGYAIGYYIVKNYLKKSKLKDWNEIIKIPPKTIIKEALL
jgi:uncharacterized protein YjaZ